MKKSIIFSTIGLLSCAFVNAEDVQRKAPVSKIAPKPPVEVIKPSQSDEDAQKETEKSIEKIVNQATKDDHAVIQVALLLDTSNSMDGLINQARTYLWKIVNELSKAQQKGKLAKLSIALYEYGNSGTGDRDENWVRQVMPFSNDLDTVSDKLFKLRTCGGHEYCGAAMSQAIKGLKWEKENANALKMIFIAGNEPFDQGKINYAEAIADCKEAGVVVNTIYCGEDLGHVYNSLRGGGSETKLWKDGATLGGGDFFIINHNSLPIDPETPYDKKIAELSVSINATYIAYGSAEVRVAKKNLQKAQDENARSLAPAAVMGRAKAKSSKSSYSNSSWDVVDYCDAEGIEVLAELKEEMLPEELKGKSKEEMQAYVKEKAEKREAIQKEIRELSNQRDAWILNWKKEQKAAGKKVERTLDDVVIESIHKQADKKGFTFEDKK